MYPRPWLYTRGGFFTQRAESLRLLAARPQELRLISSILNVV